MTWYDMGRPGYLGRKRDLAREGWNEQYGRDRWRLVWRAPVDEHEFEIACKIFYEESYFLYLSERPKLVDQICTFGEVYDNSPTNVQSGLDYKIQEAYSTHIQDIAVRNVLWRMNRKFEGPPEKMMQIRSQDTNGYFLSPGVIPFVRPDWIHTPSKCPKWATIGSVEDFWQSNKYLQVLR